MSRASILAASFPFKVFKILEHIDLAAPQWKSIISWSDHGRSFRVHNRKKFESEIMPLYFKTNHYESFRKQLSIWGFKRINGVRHPDCGSYHHELFLRGNPSLCGKIERNAKSKADERGWSFPMQEPDFSSMQPMPQSNGEPAAVGSNEQANAISSGATDTVDTKPVSSDNSSFTNGFTPNSYTSGGAEISSKASQNRRFSNPTLQQQFHPPTTTSASSPGLPSMMPQAQIPQAQQMSQMPDSANNTASVFNMLMNQLPSDQRQLLQQQIIAQLGANAQSIMNTNSMNGSTNNMVAASASANTTMMQRTPSPNDAPNMMNNTPNNMLKGSSPNNFVLNAVSSNSEILESSGVASPTNNMMQRTPSTNDASNMMNNVNEISSASNHLLRRSTSNNFNTSSMPRTGSNNNMLRRTTSNTTMQSHMLRRSTSNSLMQRTPSTNNASNMMNNVNEISSASNHLLRRSTSNNFNTSSMPRTGSNNNMLRRTTSNTTMQSHMLRRSTSNSLMPRTASQNTMKKSDSFLSKRKLMSQAMERTEVQQHSLEGSKRSKNNLLSYSRSTSEDVGNVKRYNSTPVFGQSSFHLSRSRNFNSRVNANTSANDEDGSKKNFDWYGSSNRSLGGDAVSELKEFDTASILRDRSAKNPLLSRKSASAFELNQQSSRSSHNQRQDHFGLNKRNGSTFDIVEQSDTNRQDNTQNASMFEQHSTRLANNPFLKQLSSGKLSSIGSTNTFGSSSDIASGNDLGGASIFEQHSSRLANNPFLQQLSSFGSINKPGSLTDLEPNISVPTMENSSNNADIGQVSGQDVYQKQNDRMENNPFLQMMKAEANTRENLTGRSISDFGASFGLGTLNEEELNASFETKSTKSNFATNSEISASGSLPSSDHLKRVNELFKGYKELESAVSQTKRDSRTDMLRRFKEISSISAQSIQSINSDLQIEGLSDLPSDPKQLMNVFDDSST